MQCSEAFEKRFNDHPYPTNAQQESLWHYNCWEWQALCLVMYAVNMVNIIHNMLNIIHKNETWLVLNGHTCRQVGDALWFIEPNNQKELTLTDSVPSCSYVSISQFFEQQSVDEEVASWNSASILIKYKSCAEKCWNGTTY